MSGDLTRACDQYDEQLRARGERPISRAERADVTMRANVEVAIVKSAGSVSVVCRCNWCGREAVMPAGEFVTTHYCGGPR